MRVSPIPPSGDRAGFYSRLDYQGADTISGSYRLAHGLHNGPRPLFAQLSPIDDRLNSKPASRSRAFSRIRLINSTSPLVASTLPPPISARRSPGGDLLSSLSRASFARLLRILGGGVWRAEANPLILVDWAWGSGADGTAPDSGFPGPTSDGPPAWESLVYPADLPLFQKALDEYVQTRSSAGPVDYRLILEDGELLWIRQWFLELEPGQQPDRPVVTAVVQVVSEAKRLQWEVMRTCEGERARLGQEIHDDVCQVLAGINCLTHLLQQRLATTRPGEAAELERINVEIQSGLERTRALAHGLLPAKSDFNNLQQALRELSRQVGTRFKLQLNLKLLAPPPAYSQDALLHLYRIVQEASSNAFKHGRATVVDVTFDRREGWDILSIQDNGSGLPPAVARAEGVGLNVMRNRAEMLGGILECANGTAGGALVQLRLPQRPL